MKKILLFGALGMAAAFGAQAQVQSHEFGRVIGSTPVIQQVAVPRQVCSNQPVAVQAPRSGAGSAIGAIAGGLLGNTIGHGGGRAAATMLGVIGGAVVGDRIEGNNAYQYQDVQQCSTQTYYENRTVAYNVTYEYAGRQYNVQMPHDPGPTIRLQVTPVGANSVYPSGSLAPNSLDGPDYPLSDTPQRYRQYQQQADGQAVIVAPPVMHSIQTVPGTVVYPAQAVYPAPYPYYRPYYPPLGVSLNFGYSGGHHRHRGHWR